MASLKETKERIASVKSTLKITSAMKMVASAKLHKAQSAIENMLPYERKLQEMLQLLLATLDGGGQYRSNRLTSFDPTASGPPSYVAEGGTGLSDTAATVESSEAGISRPAGPGVCLQTRKGGKAAGDSRGQSPLNGGVGKADVFGDNLHRAKVAIVALSSNSSLCGGFNSNVIRETKNRVSQIEAAGETVEVIAVGKKIAEAMKKIGYPSSADWSDLLAHTSYQAVSAFAMGLVDAFNEGKYSRIELVYNHFVSTASQKVQVETYLPMSIDSAVRQGPVADVPDEFILEPTAEEMLQGLMPQVLSLRIYTVVLDSIAAEHAARTVAMQTATENGENILQELTLEYNKGRQQKITNEILDIVGGSMQ